MSQDPGTPAGHVPETGRGAVSGRLGGFECLAVPEYRAMWGAWVVSSVGTYLQLTAGPWVMHELTGSAFMVALLATALTLPDLLFTMPAGVLADALDRRTLMVAGHVLGAVASGAMALMAMGDALTPAWLLGLSFVLGIGQALYRPSFQTLVPDLVPDELRSQAITLNAAAWNVARVVGPSIGGALIAGGLASAAFGVNAVSFLSVVGVLLWMPRPVVRTRFAGGLMRSAALGVRYVRFSPPIRALIALTAGFALTAMSLQALLPAVALEDLGLGPRGFGLLYAAFGIGALIGVASRERGRLRLGAWQLPGSILAFGVAGVVFGLSPWAPLSAVMLAVCGVAWLWTMATLNATVQLLAPRWVRGRVMSLYLLAVGMQPVGAFIAGVLAEAYGAGNGTAMVCAGTVVVGIVARRRNLPSLGAAREPMPAELETPVHPLLVPGSPVVVMTTYEIDPEQMGPFLEALREVRRERLRTGARRWSAFRDAENFARITEMYVVSDWEEHLAQLGRIDSAGMRSVRRAREFDVAGGPHTRHLAGVDLDPARRARGAQERSGEDGE